MRTTPGYNIYTLPVSRRKASGMIIGVKQQLTAEFKLIKERANNNEGEAIAITIWKGRQKKIIKNNYMHLQSSRNWTIF
jgi:hypothetical protein